MKERTNIFIHLMMLLLMVVACTKENVEVVNSLRQDDYVSVRMQVPGMKNATTRAEEAEDNLTSVWALVFRDGKLVSKTEVTTAASTLIPSTSTIGTFNLSRPKVDDVIHFLGNVPNGVTLPDVGDDESALCNLETDDRENLSYWGKATYNGGDITVNLYRHLAKIEIAPDPNECTFPEDQLFIAGLVNANQKGKLVPYDDENGAFNFDLSDENYGGNYDYCTVPAEPNPLEKTLLLDNYGAGFKNWLYVFEHENPETADGLYVICKIGKYYYKVALTSDGKTPYDIIRNHRYVIYVKDLDSVKYEIPDDITEEKEIEEYKYKQALASDPINLKVIETTSLVFNYTNNPTVYLNGGASSTLPVQITVPKDASLTEFNITTTNFTVTSSNGGTLTETQSGYSYAGGSTTFTFTPNSGLAAGTYTIKLSGSGNYLHDFTETITVTIDATMMAVTPGTATIDVDNSQNTATLTLTKPGNVSNVNVSVSADVFEVSNNGNEYTFTIEDNNIQAGDYTVTFADSNYPNVNTTATITVVNTPSLQFEYEDNTTLYLDGGDGSPTTLPVTITVPYGSSLTELNITATGFTVTASSEGLSGSEGSYTYTGGSTTFTFVPTAEGIGKTITFTGSGTNLKDIDEMIIVNVVATKPAVTRYTLWTGDDNISSLHVQLDEDDLNVIEKSVGRKLCYEYYMIQNAGWWKIDCRTGQNYELSGAATEIKYTAEKNQVYSFELTQADVELLKTHKTLDFSGSNGLMFTHIYIE